LTLKRIVVVGASLAGLRAAEALRKSGYDGSLSLVGAEPHMPYTRPPLSKQLLAGEIEPEHLLLRNGTKPYADLDLDLHLGRAATGLDLDERAVVVAGTSRLRFDALIVATGAGPRAIPEANGLAGVHSLRTLDDCLAIRAALEARPRVAIVGAGFIGLEVAATARARGLEITVIEELPVPLVRAIGPTMGAACAALHHDNGVDIRCGVVVTAVEGDERVERIGLSDGTTLEADLLVVGVGVAPETGWLESSGLALADGVVCDSTCASVTAPFVYAAGDVARWHNPLFDEPMRIEHWTNAAEQGAAAANALLAGADKATPYAPVPFFWSDQYDTKVQFVGRASPKDVTQVVHGSVEERRFVAIYGRGSRIVGALAFNWPRLLMVYRRMIAERATWEDALAHAASA
jgi:NADPH-dependent 2,4-dienoyl-CoA reductase/sulfur reductase-like enzyme